MTEVIEEIYDRTVAEEKLKSGTKYERLAAMVFKSLDHTAHVVQDMRLRGQGKETPHQIDVVIDRGDGRRRVLVECKDYTEKVGLDIVRDFKGALLQLEPVQGIIVTTSSFTSHARSYARDEHIALVQLRAFTEGDWTGRLRQINITATAVIPGEPVLTWVATGRAAEPPPGAQSTQGRMTAASALCFDDSGQPAGSLADHLAGWTLVPPMDGSREATGE